MLVFSRSAASAEAPGYLTTRSCLPPLLALALLAAAGTASAAVPSTFNFSATTFTANENGTVLNFSIRRTGSLAAPASVSFETVAGSAQAGADFVSLDGSIGWGAGDAEPKTVAVHLVDDTVIESTEEFTLRLKSAQGGVLGTRAAATGRINNDDSTYELLATQIQSAEAGGVYVTVNRTGKGIGAGRVRYVVRNGTAAAGSDFTATDGELVWDAAYGKRSILIPITADTLAEGSESFTIVLTGADDGIIMGDNRARIVIDDNDDACKLKQGETVLQDWTGKAGADAFGLFGTEIQERTVSLPTSCNVTSLRAVVSWSNLQSDVDLQMIKPDGDVLVSSQAGLGGGGVEELSVERPANGNYRVRPLVNLGANTNYRGQVLVTVGEGLPAAYTPGPGISVLEQWSGVAAGGADAGAFLGEQPESSSTGGTRHVYTVAVPATAADYLDLQVGLRWELTADRYALEVRSPSGALLNDGEGYFIDTPYQMVTVPSPATGIYTITVIEGSVRPGSRFDVSALVTRPRDTSTACETAFAETLTQPQAQIQSDLEYGIPQTLLLTFADASLRDFAAGVLPRLALADPLAAASAHVYRNLPMIALPVANTTPALVRQLIKSFGPMKLVSVWGEQPVFYDLAESTSFIGAPQAREQYGVTGKGIGVAMIDSGIDTTQGDFANVVYNAKLVAFQAIETPDSDTTSGHGTHTAGTVGGTGASSGGRFAGVAPGASLVGFGIGDGDRVPFFTAAYDFVLDPVFRKRHNIRVTNNSYGAGAARFNPADAVAVSIKAMHDAGIIGVFSAGNNGSEPNTLGAYGANPCAIGVANGTNTGVLNSSSSRGNPPSDANYDPEYVPDVTAPGSYITAPRAISGGVTPPNRDWPKYSTISGTSMAAPHVAGLVALMLEANPALDFEGVLRILKETARPMRRPDGSAYEAWEVGAGYADAAAAVARARGMATPAKAPFVLRPVPNAPMTVSGYTGTTIGTTPTGYILSLGGESDGIKVPFVLPAVSGTYTNLRVAVQLGGVAAPAEQLDITLVGPAGDAYTGAVRSTAPVSFDIASAAPGRYQLRLQEIVTSGTPYTVTVRADCVGTCAVTNPDPPPPPPPPLGTACALPGKLLFSDARGDDAPPLPTAAGGAGDVELVRVAEPADRFGKLILTLKMRSLQTLPPNVQWFMVFNGPAKGTNTTGKWHVEMQTDEAGAVSFSYGRYNAANQNLAESPDTANGDEPVALAMAGSTYDPVAGTITLVVNKANFGGVGAELKNITANVYQLVGAFGAGSLQLIDTAGSGAYTLRTATACDAPDDDLDDDGVLNPADNCPTTVNPDQLDYDADAQGDACDADDDNDGAGDDVDAFRLDPTESADTDGDGAGNNADTDDDGDFQADADDNCPLVANSDQSDSDLDGVGDACDAPPPAACADGADNDGDGWVDGADAGCAGVSDSDEADAGATQCSNGVDDADAEDTLADAADPDCGSGRDDDEARAVTTTPRVVVSVIDTGINPYHEFYYNGPSEVTEQVLTEFGIDAAHRITLTRTGNFGADYAADAAKWAGIRRGELYWFTGTNIIAASFDTAAGRRRILPDPGDAQGEHGVGTSSAVLLANPDAIILFSETGLDIGNGESEALGFHHPLVDIVSTSYGVAIQGVVGTLPENRAFNESFVSVVDEGKLHFTSAGNNPGYTPLTGGGGPWWSIGVSGVEEDNFDLLTTLITGDETYGGQGQTILAGNFPDFVGDYNQQLPYCFECETGISPSVPGTSFSTPRAAGVASRVLLEARRAVGHGGGIRVVAGQPVMAVGGPSAVTNWTLRRALEEAAWVPQTTAYTSGNYVTEISIPVNPAAPWLQVGWGELTSTGERGVVAGALAHLGFGGTAPVKAPGFCEFQTAVIVQRKAWWDSVAPRTPEDVLIGFPNSGGGYALDSDPFVYCSATVPGYDQAVATLLAQLPDSPNVRQTDAPQLTCPAAGETASVDFSGSAAAAVFGAGADPSSIHRYAVPAGCGLASMTVRIAWDQFVEDLDLAVLDPAGGSHPSADSNSETMSATEEVTLATPSAGTYTVNVQSFLNAGTAYTGTLTVTGSGAALDSDSDGISDGADNCPLVGNATQSDADGDGIGDACDTVTDTGCPLPNGPNVVATWEGSIPVALLLPLPVSEDVHDFTVSIPSSCAVSGGELLVTWTASPLGDDLDVDLTGPNQATLVSQQSSSTEERLTLTSAANGAYSARVYGFIAANTAFEARMTVNIVNAQTADDRDGDGVANGADNCPDTANAGQANLDQDGTGDACDTDIDGDGVPNSSDAFDFDATETSDSDGDGRGDNIEGVLCASDPSPACGQVGPAPARVAVAVIDTGINMYHEWWYQGGPVYGPALPSAVTPAVLSAFGVGTGCQVALTRTGNFAADYAADVAAGRWSAAAACDVVWFKGTNVLAKSFAPGDRPYLPDDYDATVDDEDVHGTGTAAAALQANPEGVLVFVEGGGGFHTALAPLLGDGSEAEQWAFSHPEIDIVSTSYGNTPLISVPSINHNDMSFEGVYQHGKLHFGAADNNPTITPIDGTGGPWWTISVAGFEEGGSSGRQPSSGLLTDFIGDFTQDLPYCDNCQTGTNPFTAGTSFATPRSAGTAGQILLKARTALGHDGGIRPVAGGRPLMAVDAAGTRSFTNWRLRRALEVAAWTPGTQAYDPVEAVLGLDLAVPMPPQQAGFVAAGWGVLTPDNGDVVDQALAQLGIGTVAEPRSKSAQYCTFQTRNIQARKTYWDTVAPESATFMNAPTPDPFEYCE